MRTRGAILHGVGKRWSEEEFELDPPQVGEVLLSNAAAGMCHSDEHIVTGDLAAPKDVMRQMGMPEMAVEGAAFNEDSRDRRITTRALDDPSAEIVFWGYLCPDQFERAVRRHQVDISPAAIAFKSQGLICAGAKTRSNAIAPQDWLNSFGISRSAAVR
ncbi:hypothetical protein A5662_03620 [Mycobacteriaceae bacterium 1482268.1]|nr:hypothetical protein A5662_03620 [Mycobacteriaceae bacterium 1482268.1]